MTWKHIGGRPRWNHGFLLLATCCVGLWPSAVLPSEKSGAAPPLVVTPNAFQGTDVERINQAIAAGVKAGCRVVIPRVNVRDVRITNVRVTEK